ncbi:MAG: F0F1 ATP synthase subunit gamma [Anaerolineae bacterium]|nr:F0F1 ATP synthase subunit gamma [Anaerolineae bacterium]
MEDIERIRERLENIRSVEPIITSLRTIAAGGWRLALKRLNACAQYVEHLSEVLAALLPHLSARQLTHPLVCQGRPEMRRVLMLVIASERGLCGAFNDVVLEGAERLIRQQQLQSEQVLVGTLGRRAESYFRARGYDLFLAQSLPVTRVASFAMVQEIGRVLVEALLSRELEAVFVVYSPYKPGGLLPPVSRRWLPIDASILPSRGSIWPQPVIETNAQALFERTVEDWVFGRLFQLVMESAASEQAARFRAMDAASNNLNRVIEELTLSYHTARQHAITMEMLDLVAGSGILRGPRGRQKK